MKKITKKILSLIIISFSLSFVLPTINYSVANAQEVTSPILIANNPVNPQAAQPANANNNTSPQTTSQEPQDLVSTYDKIIKDFSGILSTIAQAFNYLLWPILILIGGLMDNSLIFGPGIEDRLLLIWTQIRNLINLMFAVFLIAVAVYNVLGIKGDGNYALKAVLPKMIITLVLINFSFLGSKLVLDAANVATTAVFALPNAIEQGFSEERYTTIENAMCGASSPTENFKSRSFSQIGNTATQKFCDSNRSFTDSAKQFFQTYDKNNAALVMAIAFQRVPEILNPSDQVLRDPSLINLVINLILVVFLQIVYISAFFALFAVLLARIVVSWIIIALSPLIVLKWGMQGVKIPGLDLLDSFNIDEQFIRHATAPIKIGFGMSVGYIMLDAFQAIGTPSLWFSLGEDFGSVFSGLGSIPELFIGVAAIYIVWKVSFDAASETFAKHVTNGFRDWTEGIGRSVRGVIIKDSPVVPGPGNLRYSLGDLKKSIEGDGTKANPGLSGVLSNKLQKASGKNPSSTKGNQQLVNSINTSLDATSDSAFRNNLKSIKTKDQTQLFLMNMYRQGNQRKADGLTNERVNALIQEISNKGLINPRQAKNILTEINKTSNKNKNFGQLKSIPIPGNTKNIDRLLREAAGVDTGPSKVTDEAKYKQLADKISKTP